MTTARDVIAKYVHEALIARGPGADMVADQIIAALISAPDSVRQELAALLNPWREIETAPKHGTKILVYTTRKGTARAEVAYWHQPENPAAEGFWTAGIKATHWLPLPAPPSEEK